MYGHPYYLRDNSSCLHFSLIKQLFYYTPLSGILTALPCIAVTGMGGREKHSNYVEVTARFVSWYISEVVISASRLLSVINAPYMFQTCRASCKHLAMTALLPLVTRYRNERWRCRTSVGEQASCATEHWLMSDSVADNEQVVFGIILRQTKQQSTATIMCTKLLTLLYVRCYPIIC